MSLKPRRRTGGALRADLSDMQALFADPRTHTALGIVDKPDSGPHWRRTDKGDILVEVLIVPTRQEVTARLSAAAGMRGAGVWRVPAVGTEVGLIIPHGEIDHAPYIACCLSSGGAPERVSDQLTLFVAPDAIEIDAPAIRVGGEHADQAAIKGNARTTGEKLMLAAIATAMTDIAAGLTGAGQGAHAGTCTAAATAVNVFRNALDGHLSTVVKLR